MATFQRPRSREDFEIAVICALPVEFDAVEAMFDEFWEEEESFGKAPGDPNAYTTGRIGNHNVVLAFMPGMGNPTSASIAASFRSSFLHIKLGLVVGICGGVPMTPGGEEIILGDVILSTGIVQADFGRQFPDKVVRKDTLQDNLGRPNTEIRSFLAKMTGLRARTLLRNNSSHYLRDLLEKEGFENSNYLGGSNDKLHEATYRHKHRDTSICSVCSQCQGKGDEVCDVAREANCDAIHCSDNALVARDRLERVSATGPIESEVEATEQPKVVIHFGLMASGNSVMKSGLHRDEIAAKEKVIGFEMEGAGVWDNFPTIVVKSVCDYSDSHKNKRWQQYAAATAAACMKALLKQWRTADKPLETVSETQLIHYKSQNRTMYANSLVPREAWQLTKSDGDMWPQVFSRLSSYDHERAHRRLRAKRLSGTTDWFLRHETVREWIGALESSSLWCFGRVGFGKTMICTSVIDRLKELSTKTGDAVIYFYCDPSERSTLKATCLFESLIKQLLEYMVKVHKECSEEAILKLKRFYTATGPEPDLEDTVDIFSTVFPLVSGAWYILDGLDELQQSETPQMMAHLHRIFQDASKQKLFVASRHVIAPNIRVCLKLNVEVVESKTQRDIRRYIDSEISRKMEHELVLTNNPEVIEEIRNRLSEGAGGMFLWARLQIEALWLDCKSDEEIRTALDNLPGDLSTTYGRCLARIPESKNALALKVLRWLICACRPLHIDELREAVAFTLTTTEWDPSIVPPRAILISACVNLVTLDKVDGKVRMIHPSVKQYLCDSSRLVPPMFQIDEERATLACGEDCVNYLSFSNFAMALERKHETIALPSPSHVIASIPSSNVTNRITALFRSNSTPYKPRVYAPRPQQQPSDSNEVQYAFLQYAKQYWPAHTRLISKQSKVWTKFQNLALQAGSTRSFHPWTSSGQSLASHHHGMLAYAVRERHIPLLGLLLENSKETRLKTFCNLPLVEDGLPALHAASRLGFADIVSLLLRVCQVNAIDTESRTALHFAAEKNHLEVAQILVSAKGISIDSKSASQETPLGLAAGLGFEMMVQMLLNANAALLPKSAIPQNPIIAAADNEHAEVLSILLHRAGQIKREVGRMALIAAATNGRSAVITLLLMRTDVDISDCSETVLLAAMNNNHEKVVKLLLKRHDIDVNLRNGPSRDASLHGAARSKFSGNMIRLLLERDDIKVNLRNKYGSTALHLVVSHASSEVGARLLLRREDLEVNSQDKNGQTPLHVAVHERHAQSVDLLLERDDINVSSADGGGFTPLHIAVNQRNEGVVRLLLERADVKVNLANNFGKTPLHVAAWRGYEGVVRLLLERADIKVNLVDKDGQTPLHDAAYKGNEGIARLLLERADVEVNLADKTGKTPLHVAAHWHPKSSVLEQLLERKDIEISPRDGRGGTPLSLARNEGRRKLLLERGATL